MNPDEPITVKAPLIDYLAAGDEPDPGERIGLEWETFPFTAATRRPLPYAGRGSVLQLLEGLAGDGWSPLREADNLIGLSRGEDAVSLEPCGQFELAARPLRSVHEVRDAITDWLRQVKAVAVPLGIHLLGLGFFPTGGRDQHHWIPRSRYMLMRAYMPRVGSLGLDMMARTCSIQINLDVASEPDMVEKFRVALALQPVVSALFACSPFLQGGPSGFRSYRNHVWTRTDDARCGLPAFVFDSSMGYERYVDYALDTPMYSVQRGGVHLDLAGQSFRDFLRGRLPGLPGEHPTLADWKAHLNTLMPEVRLKRILELRGADSGPPEQVMAVAALWAGLLYDDQSRAAALDLTAAWTPGDRRALFFQAPRHGLGWVLRGRTLRELAMEILTLARGGLGRRNLRDPAGGRDETQYLDPVTARVQAGRTPADDLLDSWNGSWDHCPNALFSADALRS